MMGCVYSAGLDPWIRLMNILSMQNDGNHRARRTVRARHAFRTKGLRLHARSLDELHQRFVDPPSHTPNYSHLMLPVLFIRLSEPTLGPRISNWPKYSPSNSSTLAILGIDEDSAIPGDHFETDKVCDYWNTILPIYPQVRYFLPSPSSLRGAEGCIKR